MNCPHCGSEFEVKSEVRWWHLLLLTLEKSETGSGKKELPNCRRAARPANTPKSLKLPGNPTAARKGREKGAAFKAWLMAAGEVGSEVELLALVLGALRWQGPIWGADGWRFARYFERYLRQRKWEDEPPPAPTMAPRGAQPVSESFAARDERERQERAQRQREAFGEESARTHTPGRCARHLYNRTWGDCNPRCPEWKVKNAG